MSRLCAFALIVALATGIARSAEQPKAANPPIDRKFGPVPASDTALPTQVKIVSMPALPSPQVNVTIPQDNSAQRLVAVTWGLLLANLLLCVVTVWLGLKQGWDTKRRDRDTMLREISRVAHKVLAEATRVEQSARQVPPTRAHLHVLMHQGGLPPETRAETDATLMTRTSTLNTMVEDTLPLVPVLPNTNSPLPAMSDNELAEHLWRLDARQVSIDTMRDAIADELARYQTEIATRREQQTTMQAAALTARLATPLKTKLGE